MPAIAYFYGVAIQMFFDDHNPPHFHARYNPARAAVRLNCRLRQRGPSRNGRSRGGWNWKKIGVADEYTRHWNAQQGRTAMPEFPMVDVLELKPVPGQKLWLRFSDGYEGICDLSELIASGGSMVEPRQKADAFNHAFVEMGAPTWPNGPMASISTPAIFT